MSWRRLVLAAVIGAFAASSSRTHAASVQVLDGAMAERMFDACIGFAHARHGAVNIWIFDGNGGLLQFRRMDGALPPAPGDGPGAPGFALPGGPEGIAGFNAGAEDSIPVESNGRTIASVRAEGMGAFGDRACARAAAEAALPMRSPSVR